MEGDVLCVFASLRLSFIYRSNIMVLPTDIQVSFIDGAFFVDMGRKYIESEHTISPERSKLAYCKFRNMSLKYTILCLLPVIAVFFSAWPGWESQYWTVHAEKLKGNGLPSLLAGIYMILAVSAAYFGNWLSFKWITCWPHCTCLM